MSVLLTYSSKIIVKFNICIIFVFIHPGHHFETIELNVHVMEFIRVSCDGVHIAITFPLFLIEN